MVVFVCGRVCNLVSTCHIVILVDVKKRKFKVNVSESEVRNVSDSAKKLEESFTLNQSGDLKYCSGYRLISMYIINGILRCV